MKAACWYGTHDVRVEDVPDPKVLNPRDAIVRTTLTAICGSDLHLYDGVIPSMMKGDILGHEFMGEVVEVGSGVRNLKPGDRVVVPFNIACGGCFFCKTQLYSLCDNSNPNATIAAKMWGYSTAGLFGYSHLTGGYAGGQAQMVRVPFADVGPIKIPEGIPDEKVLFLSDILPTGYQAALQTNFRPGDTIAVWGCGPVGLMAVASLFLLGAQRVIAIDNIPERLAAAASLGAEPLDHNQLPVYETLMDWTAGRGPDCCIDAVGMEAHGLSLDALYDKARMAVGLATDRLHALRQIIRCCRKGGTVSVAGVYGGFADKLPIGAAFQKGLHFHGGQTHCQAHMGVLLEKIQQGFDPSFVISHRLPLEDAPCGYELFRRKLDHCTKIVMDPWGGKGYERLVASAATPAGAVLA
jgi:threonine dehydrogenase-like Zn-dependent dehydrogenase